MARKARTKAVVAALQPVARRVERGALLRGTALTAVVGLAFVAPAAAQPAVNARPQGGQVVAGSAAIGTTANTTTITQSTNRAAIDWRSFDVGRNQSVTFQQPSSASVTLNRVTGPDPSAIAGRISANGQLVLTNPSGVTFYQGSQVNAQSVIVSAAGISNRNFMAGKMVFDQAAHPNARIENQGTITVKQAGLAALVAPSVANSGTINARLGHAVLAGGAVAHTLDMYGDGLVSIDVTKHVMQAPVGPNGRVVTALVTNTGVIAADGGTVQLTARAADGVVQDLVRAGGTIRANSVGTQTGRIEIAGNGGSVVIEGRVTADGHAPGSTGGTVVAAGSTMTSVAPTARISANGYAGGGLVALGTTAARGRGTGPAPAGTSARTVLAAGSRVSADATVAGDGGRVTVLSTDTTAMGGAISARGGRVSGSGGTIELSGETGFRLTGSADTSAPHGKLGTVILDPRDLTITSTPNGTTNIPPANGVDPNIAYNTGGTVADAYVTPAQLQGLTGNVHLQATRDLTVASSFTYNSGPTGTSLTLEAGRNLTVNSGASILNGGSTYGYTLNLIAGSSAIPGYDPAGALNLQGALGANFVSLSAGTGGITLGNTIGTYFHGSTGAISFQTTGPVTQTGGFLQTGTISGTAASVSLPASNQITFLDGSTPFTTTTGGFLLASVVPPLTISAGSSGQPAVSVPIGQTITVLADALTLTGGAGAFALSAPGGTVALSPLSPSQTLVVTSIANVPPGTTAITTGQLALVQASNLQLGSGPAFTGNINIGQSGDPGVNLASGFARVTFATGGGVFQDSPLTANTLSGSVNNVFLSNTGNSIGSLSGLTSSGSLNVTTTTDLAVNGGLSANGALNLTASGTLTLAGAVNNGGGNTFLAAGNSIVTAAGSSVGANGSVFLTAAATYIPGYNPAGGVTINGSITAPQTATLSAGTGGITLAGGTLFAANILTLSTTGPVTQTGGLVRTDELNGTAASVSLPSRSNSINFVGNSAPFTVTDPAGDFLLVTGGGFLAVNAAGGGSTVSGGVSVQTGRAITLVTDYLQVGTDPNGNGSINAPGGTVVIAPFTTGGSVLLTSGTKPASGLSLTATELGQIGAPTLQLGGAQGTPFVPVAGNITVGQAGDGSIDLGSTGITRLILQSSGAVTQATGLGVATVSGAARSLNLPDPGNFIGTLDGFTATGGDIALHTSSGLLVSRSVTANNGAGNVTLSSETPITGRLDNAALVLAADVTGSTVSLNSLSGNPTVTGGIAQDAGVVTADTLTGAGYFATLTQSNQVAHLGNFATTGTLTLSDAPALQVTGTVVSTAGPVTLNAQGITQTPTSSISTGEFDGSSRADTVLDSRNNAVSGIGYFTQTAGSFTLVTQSPTLLFGGNTGVLTATAGSFNFVTDGVGLVGNPSPGTAITASGAVSFAPYTPSRRIELIGNTAADPNSLSVSRPLYSLITAGRLSLGDTNTTGGINIANAGETIDLRPVAPSLQLQTTGAVSEGISPGGQNGGGTLALDVNDVTGRGGIIRLVAPNNAISLLGAPDGVAGGVAGLQATAGILSVQSASFLTVPGTAAVGATGALTIIAPGGLTVAGIVNGNSVVLSTPGAALTQTGGTITAATNVTLQANGGTVTQSGGAITAAGTLTLQAAGGTITQTAGTMAANTLAGNATSASLGSTGNGIAQLGAFTTTGDFTLQDGQTLTVAGPLSTGSATLGVAGNLVLSGPVSAAGTLTLSVSGTVTQPGGTVAAGTLTGTAASVAMTANNAIGTLGAFTTTGAFALTDAGTLTVAGPLSAASADLRAGNLVLNGTVSTPGGTLNLSATNAITQSAGTVTAGTLTGNAASASLTGAGNAVGSLGAFTTTGAFALTDGQTLTVTGPVSAGSATLLATNLVLNGPLTTTTGTLTLNAPGGTITQPGGGISAPILAGNAASATLNGTGNAVGTLGAFTTTGAFALTDARTLTVGGPLSAASANLTTSFDLVLNGTVNVGGGTLTLSASGAVTQPGGTVTAGTLAGNAASVALNQPGNQVGNVGGFTSTGAFALTDGTTLTVAGPLSAGSVTLTDTANLILAGTVSAPTGTVTLNATGAITEPGGSIIAATLGGSAASATLNGTGNTISTLGAFTATAGNFALTDGTALTVAGPLSATNANLTVAGNLTLAGAVTTPGTLTLSATGTVTEPGGTVTAGTLTGSAASVALNSSTNAVGTLGAFTTTGALALTDNQTLTVAGPVSAGSATLAVTGNLILAGTVSAPAGTVTLNATGAITEPGGSVTAGTLTGSAASASLNGANAVGTLGAFTTTAGDFALTDNQTLTVAGPVSASNVGLTTTGSLILAGTVLAPGGTVALNATGAVTEPGGSVTAGTLTGSAASASLTGSNAISTLGAFTATGAFALADGQTLTVAGPLSASNVGLTTTGNIVLAGTVSAPTGTVALNATGTVTEPGGTVAAGILTGSAASVALNQAGNAVGTLGAFTTTGAFALVDGQTLTVSGPLAASSATLGVTGNLVLAGTVSAPTGTVTLNVSGAVTEPGGSVMAATLTGNAASASLGSGTNAVGTLGAFSATAGDFTLIDGTALTVAGPLTAANATLSAAGTLRLAGAVTTAGTLSLSATGAITEPGGTISAGTLTGNGASAALNGTGNAVGTLGAFTTPGAFALTDGTTLTVAGPVSAGSAALTINGNLLVAGTVSTPGTLALSVTGAVTEPGGSVAAGTLTGTAASASLNSGTNAVGTLGAFTATAGNLSLTDNQTLTVGGPVSASNVSLTATGGLVLAGTVSAPAGTVTLNATGAVTEPGGSVTAGTLTGSAASASLNGANTVATLGAFTATAGDFALTDTQTLIVAGPLSASNVGLTTTGGLILAGTVSAPGGTVALNATGAISQPGGIISAATLAGNGATATLNQAGNAVATLGAFTTTGAFALTDGTTLTVGGPLSAASANLTTGANLVLNGTVGVSGTLTLSAAGTVTQPGGTVTAATLSGNAASASLTGAGNAVGSLGAFTTTGAFALTDGQTLTVTGPVSAGSATLLATNLVLNGPLTTTTGTLTLNAPGGTITQPGGGISAPVLAGNAASATLNGTGNAVGTLGAFTTTGAFALTDGTTLTVAGPLSAASANLTTGGNLLVAGTISTPGTLALSVTGAVTEPGGSVTAATVSGNAVSVSLNSGTNRVGTLSAFTTTGAFALADGQTLTVAGPVSAASASFSVAGNFTLNGAVSTPTGTLALSATGAITQPGGTVVAAVLTGSAGSVSLNGSGNAVGTLSAFATTGAFALTDGQTLTVAGPVSAGSAVLTLAGDLVVSGALSTTGTLTLNATGNLTEPGGSVTAAVLTGNAASVSLNGSGNTVGTLGGFSATRGDFALSDGTGLTVAGPLSARNASLATTGDLVLAGNLSTPTGTLTLSATTGAITQTAGGITTAVLTGGAQGSVVLDSRTNAVGTLGTLAAGGDVSLTDSRSVTVAGVVSAGTGRTLRLVDDTLTFGPGSSLQAPGGTVALAEYTPGQGVVLGGPGSFVGSTAPVVANTLSIGSRTGGPVVITGAFDLSNVAVLDLESGGAISETGAGAIRVATLTGQGASVALGGANQVGTLGTFAATAGSLVFNDTGALTVSGPVSAAVNATLSASGLVLAGNLSTPAGTLTLQAAGGTITQTAGTMAANTLAGNATSASLGSTGNGIAQLGAFTTTGDFTLQDGQTLTVAGPLSTGSATLGVAGNLVLSGPVSAAGTLTLSVSGTVTQPGGTVAAGTLTGTAASVAMTANNAIGTLGAFTTTGAFALTDAGTLTVAGPLSAASADLRAGNLVLNGTVSTPGGTLNLSATNAITQSAGTVTAGTLTGNAASASLTGAGNAVGSLGAFTTTGAFALTDGQTLTVTGPVSAGSATLLATNLVLNGPLTTTTGTLTLNAPGGTITQPGGGISAPILAGNAASATLNGTGNAVGTLGAFTTTGAFALTDARTLTVGGPLSAASANLTTSFDLVLNGTVNVGGGTLTLSASGAVTQPGGTVTAGTLAGNAASVALNQPGNQVGNVGGFTSTGAFALTDGTTLTVAGPLSAGSVTLTDTANLILAGTVSAPTGTVTLNATGAITEPGGSIIAATLGGSAASATLNGTGNTISTLGAFTATAGNFALTDGTALTVAGPLSATNANLTVAGNLTLAGAVTTPGTLTLAVTGAVNEAGGTISAGALAGNAGSITLNGTGNAFGTLGAFTTTGAFALTDNQTLTVAGPVAASSVSLTTAGNLVLAGIISAPGGTVTLNAPGIITQTGGAIIAAALTGNADSASLPAAANDIATLAGFTTRGDFTLGDGRSLVVTAPVDPNTITLGINGDLLLNSSVTGTNVILNVTGTITEGANGQVVAATLSGTGAAAALTGANAVDALGTFTTRTGFALNTTGALTVSGTVSDRQSVSITTNGTMTLPGSVSAPAVTLNATNGGAIAQTGTLAAPGTLTLRADGGTTLAGIVSAGTLLVSTPGTIAQTGGTLTAGTLTGSAGRIDVGGNGTARIDVIADLAAGTTLTVVDAGALRVSGTLVAPYLTVMATGTLTLDGGVIRTAGQPLSAQTGATAAAPGSVLGVRAGADGTGTIRQLGTTTVTSYGGGTATLRLDLPASGGTLHLNNLQASGTDLALNLGSGTADGALVVRNLSVRGAGGSATFTGQVQGRTDTTAAQVSAISPAVDLRYTINNCAIAILSCSASTSPGSTFIAFFEAAAIASTLRPDILALDVLDLSVTRDRDDPTLLLPNISDRDY